MTVKRELKPFVYTEQQVYREVRKLTYIINNFGDCLVPSIFVDESDTTANQRLGWLILNSREQFGMTKESLDAGIAALDRLEEKENR